MVRFSSILALLAFAVQHDMLIHHMDLVTAFVNGQLEEKIGGKNNQMATSNQEKKIWSVS